jgi:chorismate synthase
MWLYFIAPERSSARETAIRTAVGFLCAGFLKQFDIKSFAYVFQIGDAISHESYTKYEEVEKFLDNSELRTFDKKAEAEMIEIIKKCKQEGDSIGGRFKVVVRGLPIGLGSYTQWDRKLDGKIAQGLIGLQAIKEVDFGIGTDYGKYSGSNVHDPIHFEEGIGFLRGTNNAGGIEGGMTNGEDIIINAIIQEM